MAKNRVGRPSDYKPEYCDMLIEHMSKGFSFSTFGAVIDVNVDTLHEWAKVHPDFSDAKRQAFNKCKMFWEDLGIQHVISKSESEQEGSTKKSSTRNLNSAVWIYNMKCRFRDEWIEEKKIDLSGQLDSKRSISDDDVQVLKDLTEATNNFIELAKKQKSK